MVHPGTLLHRRQRGIPGHSYENRSQIRALRARSARGPLAASWRPSAAQRSIAPEAAAAAASARWYKDTGGLMVSLCQVRPGEALHFVPAGRHWVWPAVEQVKPVPLAARHYGRCRLQR